MTDPGDKPPTWIWNLPVHACSFLTAEGDWLGLSVPGALPVGVTRLNMHRQRFSMTFQILRPACEEGQMPEVYFIPGLRDPYDCLDSHRAISEAKGLTVEKSPDHPRWWSHPTFKCWDEVVRLQGGAFKYDNQGNPSTVMTREQMLEWLEKVEQSCGLQGRLNIVFDQYWSYRYGSREVTKELGGVAGFRGFIDSLRERGLRYGRGFPTARAMSLTCRFDIRCAISGLGARTVRQWTSTIAAASPYVGRDTPRRSNWPHPCYSLSSSIRRLWGSNALTSSTS